MKKLFSLTILILNSFNVVFAKDYEFKAEDLFYLDQMNSHNQDFALFFKSREKSVLARG